MENIKEEDIINCKLIVRDCKTDIEIRIKDNKKNLSIKSGSGVSVHTEYIDSFLDFLKIIDNILESLEFIKNFYFRDGTLNESGKEIKGIIKKRNSYHQKIDYLYYGNKNKGMILSKEDIIIFS